MAAVLKPNLVSGTSGSYDLGLPNGENLVELFSIVLFF
jgi:hypothetical protein